MKRSDLNGAGSVYNTHRKISSDRVATPLSYSSTGLCGATERLLLFLAAFCLQHVKAVLTAVSLTVKGDVIVCCVGSDGSELVLQMILWTFSVPIQ